MDRMIPYYKEAQEIANVVDSLPTESRRFIRALVFRVAAVARQPATSLRRSSRNRRSAI